MNDPFGPLPGLAELALVVDPIAQRFRAAGFRLYLVGGVVRDLVLARHRDQPMTGNDIDLTTNARPDDIKRLVGPLADAVWTQGERFGTIGARVEGRDLEITTHRAEAYDPESRKPVVSFGDDLAEDLARRDFTVNAAAIELPGRVLHDPHGGLDDLRHNRLRTPLSAEISFTDDPLRMLRAARFIPRFDLVPSADVVGAATELAPRLDIVSVERVADELERLLTVDRPRAGFDFLVAAGLLGRVIPALAAVGGQEEERAVALSSVPGPGPGGDPSVRRAGLLWPIRHRAGDQLARLRYSRALVARTLSILAGAELALASPPEPPTVRRLAARTGVDDLDLVLALAANLATVGEAEEPQITALAAVAGGVRRAEDLSDLDGPLTGAEVMEVLGVEPGPMVGQALAHLRELRLDRGPIGPDRARQELRRWARQDPDPGSSLP